METRRNTNKRIIKRNEERQTRWAIKDVLVTKRKISIFGIPERKKDLKNGLSSHPKALAGPQPVSQRGSNVIANQVRKAKRKGGMVINRKPVS